jgi:hypothetical protein
MHMQLGDMVQPWLFSTTTGSDRARLAITCKTWTAFENLRSIGFANISANLVVVLSNPDFDLL